MVKNLNNVLFDPSSLLRTMLILTQLSNSTSLYELNIEPMINDLTIEKLSYKIYIVFFKLTH